MIPAYTKSSMSPKKQTYPAPSSIYPSNKAAKVDRVKYTNTNTNAAKAGGKDNKESFELKDEEANRTLPGPGTAAT